MTTEQQIEQIHTEVNNLVSLTKKAIAHLEELAEINPSFKPVVQIAINQIKNAIENTIKRMHVEN